MSATASTSSTEVKSPEQFATSSIPTGSLRKIRVGETDVYLENFEHGRGKLMISDSYGHNYSYFWGAMSGTLEEFILRINEFYFAGKLHGAQNDSVINVKKTFAALRKFIRQEFELPWYKEMDFQEHMREVLKDFQECCEENASDTYFVDHFWYKFVNCLHFWKINDKYDRDSIEQNFKGLNEPWQFIQSEHSPSYKWLIKFHGQLKKEIIRLKLATPKQEPATTAPSNKNADNKNISEDLPF